MQPEERIITGQQKRRDGTNERPQDLGTLGLWKRSGRREFHCSELYSKL